MIDCKRCGNHECRLCGTAARIASCKSHKPYAPKPITNYDRLSNDIEHLAQFLADLSGGDCPPDSPECEYCRMGGEPWKCWLDWLRQEVEA